MTNNSRPPIIWGILLAAGQGRRFAQARPGQDKLLQPLPHGLSVLQTSTQALAQHCAFTLVITLPEHHQRHEQVHLMAQNQNTVELFSSAAGHAGMGASLAAAALALEQRATQEQQTPDGVLVALADMPGIQPSSYQAVIQALVSNPDKTEQKTTKRPFIAAPTYAQQRGHPVGFSWALSKELAQLKGDQGARDLLKRYGCKMVSVQDPAVLKDIDHPEQLQDFQR